MNQHCTDNHAYRYPVSIKGIVIIDGKIPLLKNERDEYELPGGKLEIGEQPVDCAAREINEELNIDVAVNSIIDSWLYTINSDTRVVIITYGCTLLSNHKNIKISNEHKDILMASIDDINSINMPDGYKNSIRKWFLKTQASSE